jgi:rhamnosyltransferase
MDVLYVVDNSDIKNYELISKIKEIKNCEYIDNNGNKGIANALNVGANLAIQNNSDWLLTMDQDSNFENNNFEKLINFIFEYDTAKIGIISPFHKTHSGKSKKYGYEDVLITMTSGNLLNLDIYSKVGPFLDDLFIDSVDHEYCLRLNKNGYRVVAVNESILNHNLGESYVLNLYFKNLYFYKHSPLRNYYIMRNRLYVASKYRKIFPNFFLGTLRAILTELLLIILFEDQKSLKLNNILKGYLDFKNKKFGKKDTM